MQRLASEKPNIKKLFDNIMEIAQSISVENPNALSELIKTLLLPLQTNLIIDVIEKDDHKCAKAVERANFFCEGKAGGIFVDSNLESLSKDQFKVRLATDVVFPCPWLRSRMIKSLAHIGSGKKMGGWSQDFQNHHLTLWLPWKIAFVNGGNHSIAAGIIAGEGELIPEAVFDMSHTLEKINCDGRHYIETNTGKIISKVQDYRIAAVFEIGRLLQTQNKLNSN